MKILAYVNNDSCEIFGSVLSMYVHFFFLLLKVKKLIWCAMMCSEIYTARIDHIKESEKLENEEFTIGACSKIF